MGHVGMRWSASMAGGVLCAALLATPAWADGDGEAPKQKDKPKERAAVVESSTCVVEGLSPEQVEKALALLKEHHPKVEAKGKEGRLKVWSQDPAAFKAALAALQESGVPAIDAMRRAALKKEGAKGAPSDADFEAKIAALEHKLVAAREAGKEREVAEIERHLDEVRAARKRAAAERSGGGAKGELDLQQARKRLEEARRALELAERNAQRGREMPRMDMDAAQVEALRRYLEELSRPEGAQRGAPQGAGPRGPFGPRDGGPRAGGPPPGGPGPQGRGPGGPGGPGGRGPGAGPAGAMAPLHERMMHTRAALEHLMAAGLTEQAERTRHALERMERAARDQGPGDRPGMGMGMGPGGPGRGMGGPGPQGPGPRGPMPGQAGRMRGGPPGHMPPPMPPAQGQGAELHTVPEGPPPSVGGVRRGTIHARPHLQRTGSAQPMPPAPPTPPMPPRPPQGMGRPGGAMGPGAVTVFGELPDGARPGAPGQPNARRIDIDIDGTQVLVIEEAQGTGPRRMRVEAQKAGPVVVLDDRTDVLPPRQGKTFVLEGREGAAHAPAGERAAADARQIEELRAEMQVLKKQLQEMLRLLEKR